MVLLSTSFGKMLLCRKIFKMNLKVQHSTYILSIILRHSPRKGRLRFLCLILLKYISYEYSIIIMEFSHYAYLLLNMKRVFGARVHATWVPRPLSYRVFLTCLCSWMWSTAFTFKHSELTGALPVFTTHRSDAIFWWVKKKYSLIWMLLWNTIQ